MFNDKYDLFYAVYLHLMRLFCREVFNDKFDLLYEGHLQLRPTSVHSHVLGEGGGKIASRGLPVRQV